MRAFVAQFANTRQCPDRKKAHSIDKIIVDTAIISGISSDSGYKDMEPVFFSERALMQSGT
jgi:hypothetical protein